MTAHRAPTFVPALVLAVWLGLGAAQADIRIGLSAPLTGPDAAFGQGLRLGAEQAVADLNRAGGIGGQRLVLVVADDAGDGKQGLAVARGFAAERVRFVIGPSTRASRAPCCRPTRRLGSSRCCRGRASPPDGQGPAERVPHGPDDAEQGARAGIYLAERHAGQRVGLVHDKSPYGRGLADAAARVLKAKGQPEPPSRPWRGARGTPPPSWPV